MKTNNCRLNTEVQMVNEQLLISADDYARIHQITRAVMDGLCPGHSAGACLVFVLVGTRLLNAVHRLPAKPVLGSAFFGVGGEAPNILSFARQESGNFVSDENAFHAWIECGHWLIDFMAPVFADSAKGSPLAQRVPRKMLQRPLASMSSNPDVQGAGSFHLVRNQVLADKLFSKAISRDSLVDIIQICEEWYRPAPHPMAPMIRVGGSDGKRHVLRLPPAERYAAW